jgi:hypothetical protein
MGALMTWRLAALLALLGGGGRGQSGPASRPQSGPATRPASIPAALSLRGQLVDNGGVPLAGVAVTAVPQAPAAPRDAVTDEHGVFTIAGLPAGEAQLRIAHAGSHATPHPSRVRVEPDAPDVQIKARALPVLRGVVVDRDLRAVGKSEVVLVFPHGGTVLGTDDRGAFKAVVAPPKDGLLVVARNAAAGLAGSTVWDGAQEVISVPVTAPAVASGVVRDREGNGVEGARVRVVIAQGVLASGATDEKGGYRFELLPAGLPVRVVAGVGPGSGETSSQSVVTVAGQEAKLPEITIGG